MRTLRARLTLSYAFLTAVALSIAVLTVGRVTFEIAMRPMLQAVDVSTAEARAIVAADPMASTADLLGRIQRVAAQPGLVTILRPPPLPPGRNALYLRPRPRGPAEMNLKSLLGITDRFVPVNNAGIVIIPDGRATDAIVQRYLEGVGIALFFVLVASWLVGRWIAELAIAPLRKVTAELQRFASGDFSQRPVAPRDHDEVGELIVAYNGATAQVAAAFAERQRVDGHMRRFVSDAGHELRTPLTIIGGFLTILENGGYRDPQVRERAFVTLAREMSRMRRLVERLMSLARLERPESTALSEVDFVELASDAIVALSTARKRTVDVRRADDASVFGDPAELHEAVTNLVDNALKYGDGTAVVVDLVRENGEAVLRVADGGPGIPEGERGHLFERFYRGEGGKTIEGSGLGLAIVARAAQRAGGRVVLENADPGRTSFALRLPLYGAPQASRKL